MDRQEARVRYRDFHARLRGFSQGGGTEAGVDC